MTICHVCSREIPEDEPCRSFEFEGTTYTFCEEHDSPNYIATDCDDNRAPSDMVRIYYRYDGNSSSRNRDALRFFEGHDNDEGFTCENCDNDFYGDGVITADTGDRYCVYCAENTLHYDDNSNEYYEHLGDDADQESRGGYCSYPGEQTERFLASPLVGIEFEHAPVRGSSSLFHAIGNSSIFKEHYDGSIAKVDGYTSSEIVSMPSSGKKLESVIDAFYSPFVSGEFSPGPENHTCGFHVHVESRFLWKFKNGLSSNHVTPATIAYANLLLTYMDQICKEFISSTRKKNTYCSSRPAVRDKNTGLSGGLAMRAIYGSSGYPSIAVRTIGTIEFRLWPSSNSIRYTRARVELSQKLVKYMDDTLIDENGTIAPNEAKINTLRDLARMCCGRERHKLPDALQELLGLSESTTNSLIQMSSKFNPFSSGRTSFKFTELQLSILGEEDSSANTDIRTPDENSTIIDSGDTTININSDDGVHGVYLAFGECVKCYPPTSAVLEHVKAFAKGEK